MNWFLNRFLKQAEQPQAPEPEPEPEEPEEETQDVDETTEYKDRVGLG